MSTTTNTGLNQPAYNSTSPTWDQPLNFNETILDAVLGNTTSVAMPTGASATTTLTGPTSTGSLGQTQAMRITLTGSLSANQILQFPSGVAGKWIIYNTTSGSFSVTVSSAGGGTAVSVPQGYNVSIYSDGTNIRYTDDGLTNNFATLTVLGNTYLATTSGNVGIGTTSPNAKLEVYGQRVRINAAADPGVELANTTTVKGYMFYDTTNDLVIVRHASTGTGIAVNSSGNVGIGTTTVAANLVVYGSATGVSQARVGNSIVQIQDGQGRVVANFLGGVDGSTKPTYATLNLGGAASTSIAFSLATTHGVSIGSNSATISTTGVVAAPTINAGTIGNSGTTFTGATANFNGGLSQVAQTFNTNPASVDAGRIFAIYNTNYLPGASYSSSDNRIIDIGVTTGNIAYIRTGGTNGLQLNAGGNGFSFNNAILPTSNASINIGGTGSNYWNNIYAVNFVGTSTTAKYADLAEMYLADAQYQPGTVLIFGGDDEVTTTDISHDPRIAGIVSTNPAYLMNDNFEDGYYVPVGLTGRLPCFVQGPVKKGDILVASSIKGVAQKLSDSEYRVGCVIGKCLENHDLDTIKKIEVVVGRF